MKKKNIIISAILAAALLAGCAAQPDTMLGTDPNTGADGHTHTAQGDWDWNGKEHWHLCECGEKADAAAHELNDEMRCTGCGAEVWAMDDGSADVYTYDQYGNILRHAYFEADGNMASESRYENEYDDAGNLLVSRFYSDGFLQNEDTYAANDSGEYVIEKSTMYYEGGSTLNEYDQNGNMVHMSDTDEAGNVEAEVWYEYAMDADGGFYESKMIERLAEGGKLEAQYNPMGDIIVRIWYDDADNETRVDTWEYEYGEEGEDLWQKQYTDGVLVYEITGYGEFTGSDYSMRYPETIIEYYEDGTRLEQKYGSNGEVETETAYSAGGDVVEVLTYTYETFEDGNWKSIQIHNGDKLVTDKQYAQMDGGSYLQTETVYNEDGTTTVTTYDEDGNAIE